MPGRGIRQKRRFPALEEKGMVEICLEDWQTWDSGLFSESISPAGRRAKYVTENNIFDKNLVGRPQNILGRATLAYASAVKNMTWFPQVPKKIISTKLLSLEELLGSGKIVFLY